MYNCKYCGKECSSKMSLIKHEQYCLNNPDHLSRDIFKQTAKKANETKKKKYPKKSKIKYDLVCEHCGKKYTLYLFERDYLSGRYSKYCSRSCANSRIHSEETKQKISNSALATAGVYKQKERVCKYCGKIYKRSKNNDSTLMFCSKNCYKQFRLHYRDFMSEDSLRRLSESGRRICSSEFNNKRSKSEIYFCELCESHFNNVLANQTIFNGWDADIILPDLKIAILYNGAWHYIQISKKVSLKQIQNRDKIKIEEIKKCGYTPYIIKDLGSFNKKFIEDQFNIFLKYIESREI